MCGPGQPGPRAVDGLSKVASEILADRHLYLRAKQSSSETEPAAPRSVHGSQSPTPLSLAWQVCWGGGSSTPGAGCFITPSCGIHTLFMLFSIDVVALDRSLRGGEGLAPIGSLQGHQHSPESAQLPGAAGRTNKSLPDQSRGPAGVCLRSSPPVGGLGQHPSLHHRREFSIRKTRAEESSPSQSTRCSSNESFPWRISPLIHAT